MTEQFRTEDDYFATRSEQLVRAVARDHALSRRELLRLGAAGLPLLAGFASLAAPRAARADNGSPISKPLPPAWFTTFGTNAEMRWESIQGIGYTVPNERFFVRDHTGTAVIDAPSWRLRVFGSGLRNAPDSSRAVEFSLDDLKKLPAKTVTAFIECAGNGRSFFSSQQGTPAAGTQWQLGAIGVAAWTGVRLRDVLERAGLLGSAVDVMPSGLDSAVVAAGVDAGRVRRPIPVAKALDDALLAYGMNGKPLPLDHGYPLRLIVPGWIGVANVKWVGQLEVSSAPLYSLWNTTQYVLTGPTYSGSPVLSTQAVKSAFELPVGAVFPAGRLQILTGRSWSGNGAIRRVEISTDGGITWKPAQLHGANIPKAWARWRFSWTPTAPGTYQLQARATDTTGAVQPAAVPFNDAGYGFTAIVKHRVVVA